MVNLQLEVIVLPVADVDRSKDFYTRIGFREDVDYAGPGGYRVVHLTPPGSPTSILFGQGVTDAEPGSVQGLHLVVDDILVARKELDERGAEPGEVFHDAGGVFHHAGYGRPRRRSAPDPSVVRLVPVLRGPGRQRLRAAGGHEPDPGPGRPRGLPLRRRRGAGAS